MDIAQVPALRAKRIAYWKRVKHLTSVLLAVWFITTFCVIYFARELSTVTFFGWSLSFYMAAQGLVLIYVALIAVYTVRMHSIERKYKGEI